MTSLLALWFQGQSLPEHYFVKSCCTPTGSLFCFQNKSTQPDRFKTQKGGFRKPLPTEINVICLNQDDSKHTNKEKPLNLLHHCNNCKQEQWLTLGWKQIAVTKSICWKQHRHSDLEICHNLQKKVSKLLVLNGSILFHKKIKNEGLVNEELDKFETNTIRKPLRNTERRCHSTCIIQQLYDVMVLHVQMPKLSCSPKSTFQRMY